MEIVWKYNEETRSKIKHAFVELNIRSSICGEFLRWDLSTGWRDDEKGLAKRRECKKCITKVSKIS